MRRVDPGFDPHGVLAAPIELNARYDTIDQGRSRSSTRSSKSEPRAIPGVTAAALASSMPFNGTGYTSDFIAYGRPEGGYGTEIGNRSVTPSYFATMKVPVLRGRTFDREDRSGSTPVLVINEALAKSYFKGQDPIGQRIAFDKVPTPKSTWYTIIGVVGNEHVDALDVAPRIEAFHAEAQEPSGYMVVLLRTNGDPAALTPALAWRAARSRSDARTCSTSRRWTICAIDRWPARASSRRCCSRSR